jgi:hypothetical protein
LNELFRSGGLGVGAHMLTELMRNPNNLPLSDLALPFAGGVAVVTAISDVKRLVEAFRAARATLKATGDKAYAAGRVAPAALRVINDVAMVIHPAFIASSIGLTVLNHFLGRRRRAPTPAEPTDPVPAAG